MEKDSEPGPHSSFCLKDLSIASPRPATESELSLQSRFPEPAGEREGPAALGGPSVWPSVTSQKQTVPSGSVPHVPKIAAVPQRQQESGPACWMLLPPVPAPPPTRAESLTL